METIGNRLLELRKSKGFTQEGLSAELNVSRQSISNWELDKSLPDTDRLLQLARLYEVSLDYIAYGNKDETNNNDNEYPSEDIKNIVTLLSDSEIMNKNTHKISRYIFVAILCCGGLLIASLIIFVSVFSHLATDSDTMNSELVTVNQVLDQYTYAEVTKLDAQGNYAKDKVWLDTKNLKENDYIFTYTEPGKPKSMKFEYYTKTMMIPFAIVVLLVAVEALLTISFLNLYRKKARK